MISRTVRFCHFLFRIILLDDALDCLISFTDFIYAFQVQFYYEGKHNMSNVMRKLDFCLCENKGADQLRSKYEADQRLCFCYTDSTIPLLLESKISSFYPSSVAA